MGSEEYITIFLILVCTIGLTGGFIYSTYETELSNEPNAFTGQVHTRGQLYFMFGFTSLMIFTLFWGFIYFAGRSIENRTFNGQK